MKKYNLTITFIAEHLKPEYYAQIPHTEFKEETIGLLVYLPGRRTKFYPWTAIAKFEKEALG